MIQVKILESGEIKFVMPNVAHGLIDRGEATLYRGKSPQYATRQMTAESIGEDPKSISQGKNKGKTRLYKAK